MDRKSADQASLERLAMEEARALATVLQGAPGTDRQAYVVAVVAEPDGRTVLVGTCSAPSAGRLQVLGFAQALERLARGLRDLLSTEATHD